MSNKPAAGAGVPRPFKNMRITFWGVQGTCPIFPAPHEVTEYARRIAIHTLTQLVEERQQRVPTGLFGLEELLRGPATAQGIEACQQRLGLPPLPVYGGDTTCVEIETAEGNVIILDAGSGIRHAAKSIIRRWERKRKREVHLLGTHEHLDHRSGLPFARICFLPNNPFTIHVYGSRQFLNALDERFGIFSRKMTKMTHLDDPIDFSIMPAKFTGQELRPSHQPADRPADRPPWTLRDLDEPIRIGKTVVTAFDVYHGKTRCIAYKVRHGDATFVFATDHELRHGPDAKDPRQVRSAAAEDRIVRECADADLAYFDGQYFLSEYMGLKGIGTSPPVPRMDWGHSCIEDLVARAEKCRVKHTLIGHHDPEREWPEKVDIDQQFVSLSESKGIKIELAKGDAVFDL